MSSRRIKIKQRWNQLRFYLSFLLLGFYLAVGGVFLFTDTWADLLPQGRTVIGIILILFGLLRFYVAYRRYVNKNMRIESLKKLSENVSAQ